MQESINCKHECSKPYVYLTPTAFVKKFIDLSIENNFNFLYLYAFYDSSYVKNDKFDDKCFIIKPLYVSVDKYTIFDKNDIRKIFNSKNVFIKVNKRYVFTDYDARDGSILVIYTKPSTYVKNNTTIKYYPCEKRYDLFFTGDPDTIRERIADRDVKI